MQVFPKDAKEKLELETGKKIVSIKNNKDINRVANSEKIGAKLPRLRA